MDAKRREEILKECDLGWLNQKLTDKMFDLTEKATAEEILEAWFGSAGSEKEHEKQAKKFGVE